MSSRTRACWWVAAWAVALVADATAQITGEVRPIDLVDGAATLVLDFTGHDYELILYSEAEAGEDTARTYSYTVSGAATAGKLAVRNHQGRSRVSGRDRLESLLRRQERILADEIRREGGWSRAIRKVARPNQIGDERTFVFPAFGQVEEDATVTATLVAVGTRSLSYLDNATSPSAGSITVDDILRMADRFDRDYGRSVNVFGAPSDVDGDGRVLFLFTPLVDRVGDRVAGFYSARSLRPPGEGGNGADMMFIGPSLPIPFYASLLAHEFQHLINFNQHALVRNGDSEESWLNEGLSHVIEDIVDEHVEGGNGNLVETYMSSPERYALTGAASLNRGIRGAAYLFLRGLVDEFGEGVLASLTQTGLKGRANVERVTGGNLKDHFRSFVARSFLSGNGLTDDALLNHEYAFFAHPVTGVRTMPPPRERVFPGPASPVSDEVRPMASAYVRLEGAGPAQRVSVTTEQSGRFGALLIPLPKGFYPRLALPLDLVTLDAPMARMYPSGTQVRISGAVSDDRVTALRLVFRLRNNPERDATFWLDVSGGRFDQDIILDPALAGEHEVSVYAGQRESRLPFVGMLYPVGVASSGQDEVFLPVDYFARIRLDETLPTRLESGVSMRVSGRIADPSVTFGLLRLRSRQNGDDEQDFVFYIADGRFDRTLNFATHTVGEHDLLIYAGPDRDHQVIVGSYSPVTILNPPEGGEVPGDINNDGRVTLRDAVTILRFVAGRQGIADGQRQAADIDDDGMVTTEDALRILRLSAELAGSLPDTTSGSQTTGTSGTPIVAVQDTTTFPGASTVPVAVELKGVPEIAAARMVLSYSPEALDLKEVRLADGASDCHLVANTQTQGRVVVVLARATAPPADTGPRVNLVFDVEGNALPDGYLIQVVTAQLEGVHRPMGLPELAPGILTVTSLNQAPSGSIVLLAGSRQEGYGGDGGQAAEARLWRPRGVASDSDGSIYIADSFNHRIRRVDASGVITTVAGNGTSGFSGDGGPATDTSLNGPTGVCVGPGGCIYIADEGNNRIRMIDAPGRISTLAGTGEGEFSGDGGPATQAGLHAPSDVCVDAGGGVCVSDRANNRIRKVNTSGTITTVAGGEGGGFRGDGGPATAASLQAPSGVFLDSARNLFIADRGNHRLRRIDASGTITTVAGSGTAGYAGDGGQATEARLNTPSGVCVDRDGNVYVADTYNHRVRRVDVRAGTISTVAGGRLRGSSGDGGWATDAMLNAPAGVAMGPRGSLHIADTYNHKVRRVLRITSPLEVVPEEPPLPVEIVARSDFNGDGIVNFPDFIEFARRFGKRSEDPAFSPAYDLDDNGSVEFADFVQFARAFGLVAQEAR